MRTWVSWIISRAKTYDMFDSILGANPLSLDYDINIMYPKSSRSNKHREPIESSVSHKFVGSKLRRCDSPECRDCANGSEPCRTRECYAHNRGRSKNRREARINARATVARNKRQRRGGSRIWSRAYVEHFGDIE